MQRLTSNKPYLLRAFYEWIIDNGCTPYLIINAEVEDVIVPRQYVDDGRIVLNIAESAVRGLEMSNDAIEFDARFGGVAVTVYAPMIAVVAIYAHENGRGMVFTEEDSEMEANDAHRFAEAADDDEETPPPPPSPITPHPGGKPKLRIIK
ncbi:MAG: ClpXP protease specificity-enhancing factor [Gammaproteobacteria bacterium]|nr:ClpXP protease specificity-enhancing factor [Gammaproteobacteria bacterium]